MKRFYAFIMFFVFAGSISAMPGSLVSVNPDSAFQGQYINLDVTYPANVLMGASPGDLSFTAPGLPGFTIPWSNVQWYDPWTSIVTYGVQIPAGADPALYNITARTGYLDMWTFQFVNTDSFDLLNAFTVVEVNVHGRVFLDDNGNGTYQPGLGERYWSGRRIDVSPDSISTYTDHNGIFLFNLPNGSHTIQYVPGPGETVTTSNNPTTININNSTHNIGLIGVQTPATYSISGWTYHGRRCNRTTNGYVSVRNNSNRVVNATLVLVKDPNLTVLSTSITPASVSGDTMTWNFTNLNPGQSVYVDMLDSIPGAGDTLHSYVTATAFNGVTPVDTSNYHFWTIVTCAYDPNDKHADPPGVQAQHYTLIGESLLYHINFQNTGNDTAFDITVRDTLDSNLDLSTFEFLGSSHNTIVSLNHLTRVVEFRMNNILLPDSNVNEPGSHGYVEYRIHHVNGIADGTVLNNTAHIYFDFNPPIATNTTMNTMVFIIPTGISGPGAEAGISVYPNPVGQEAIFDLGKHRGPYRLEIWNETGQRVHLNEFSTPQYRLSAGRLAPGIYWYQVTGNDLNARGRFIVSGK